MRHPFLCLVAIVLALPSWGQLPITRDQKSIKGHFYVAVDDTAAIYVNGKETYKVALAGETRSPEVEIKPGDRVVVQLQNVDAGNRRFMLIFASSDEQSIVSLRSRDFKVIEDLDVVDFGIEKFQKWTKTAKQEKRKDNAGHILPIKSYSDWVWGDLDKFTLGAIITPQMVT